MLHSVAPEEVAYAYMIGRAAKHPSEGVRMGNSALGSMA